MRLKRHKQDPELAEYRGACGRANALFALAVLFAVVWGATLYVGADNASHVSKALNSLVRTVFGWGSITALALSLLQAAYAYLSLRLATRPW